MTGLEKARALDRAYFRRHPKALSYLRPLVSGECLALPAGVAVDCVAVAYVSRGFTVKAIVRPGEDRKAARREVEEIAARLRGGARRGVEA